MPMFQVTVRETRSYETNYYVAAADAEEALDKAETGDTVREFDEEFHEVTGRWPDPSSVREVDGLVVEAELALDSLEADYPEYYADLARYTRLGAAVADYRNAPADASTDCRDFLTRDLKEAIAYAKRRDVPAGDE